MSDAAFRSSSGRACGREGSGFPALRLRLAAPFLCAALLAACNTEHHARRKALLRAAADPGRRGPIHRGGRRDHRPLRRAEGDPARGAGQAGQARRHLPGAAHALPPCDEARAVRAHPLHRRRLSQRGDRQGCRRHAAAGAHLPGTVPAGARAARIGSDTTSRSRSIGRSPPAWAGAPRRTRGRHLPAGPGQGGPGSTTAFKHKPSYKLDAAQKAVDGHLSLPGHGQGRIFRSS